MKSLSNITSGIWFGKLNLLQNENIKISCLANHSKSKLRKVGGQIILTNHRFIFNPHLIDKIFGGKQVILNIDEIDSVKVESNNRLPGMLKVSSSDGKFYYFIVNDISKLYANLPKEIVVNGVGS